NGGPHRFFIDHWERDGDFYRLSETISLASTYKTAAEFCYSLLFGNDRRAATWTTSAAVVSTAHQLGMDKLLHDDGVLWAADDDQRGTVVISLYKPRIGLDNFVLLRMVKGQSDWLISSIEKTDSLTPPAK